MSADDITGWLQRASSGDGEAREKLLKLIYDELYRRAKAYMAHERPDHTLEPTILVHDAYVRLLHDAKIEWQGRTHFLALAARTMRRALIDHARQHKVRFGSRNRVTLETGLKSGRESRTDILDLDEALKRLAAVDERKARVIELRFFGGMSIEEVAGELGITERQVYRDWKVAKLYLLKELRDSDEDRERPSL